MSGMNFNTANQTFRQLLGNGLTHLVPHSSTTTRGRTTRGTISGRTLRVFLRKTESYGRAECLQGIRNAECARGTAFRNGSAKELPVFAGQLRNYS